MNAARDQFEKLDQSARHAIKVRGDLGETQWISVSPDVVRRIADVLDEAQVQVPPIELFVHSTFPGTPNAVFSCLAHTSMVN